MASRNSTTTEPAKKTATASTAKKTTRTTAEKSVAPQPEATAADNTEKPAKKAAAPRSKTSALASGGNAVQLSAEKRLRQVAEAAYFIAERRGFAPGHDVEDWLEAESEIDRLLAGTTRH